MADVFIVEVGPLEIKGDYFEGYLSSSAVDSYNDIVTKACQEDMVKQINSKSIKGSFEHIGRSKDLPITSSDDLIPPSRLIEGKMDDKGLWVRGEMNPHHPKYESLKNLIKDGWENGLSIEFRAMEFVPAEKNNGKRLLNKVALGGYGHTARPSNPDCTLTNFFTKSVEMANIEVAESAFQEKKSKEEKIMAEKIEVSDAVKSENEALKAKLEGLEAKNAQLEKDGAEFKAFMAKQVEIKTAIEKKLENAPVEQKNIVPPASENKTEQTETEVKIPDLTVKSMIQSAYGKPRM